MVGKNYLFGTGNASIKCTGCQEDISPMLKVVSVVLWLWSSWCSDSSHLAMWCPQHLLYYRHAGLSSNRWGISTYPDLTWAAFSAADSYPQANSAFQKLSKKTKNTRKHLCFTAWGQRFGIYFGGTLRHSDLGAGTYGKGACGTDKSPWKRQIPLVLL